MKRYWEMRFADEKTEQIMNISVGDVITLKKKHPCGSFEWQVSRIGADFKIKCLGCNREMMLPRVKVEKSIKKVNGEKV